MQVERALKLVASGTITVEMVRNAKGRIPTLPKQLNQATGKASNQLTAFNEIAWGAHCSSYVKSAKKLSNSRFDEIVSLSAEYMKANYNLDDDEVIEINDEVIEINDDDSDIRANVIDCYSSEDDIFCSWILLLVDHWLFILLF